MRSISLLKTILSIPNIFANEAQRQEAKINLNEKMKRRDRKLMKKQQLSLPFTPSQEK